MVGQAVAACPSLKVSFPTIRWPGLVLADLVRHPYSAVHPLIWHGSWRARDMRLINPKRFLPLAICVTLAAIAAEPPKPSIFEVRLVLDAPSADSDQLEMKSPDGQAIVFNVQRVPLLDQSDVQSAAVAQDSETGQPRIQIMFTPQGRKRLAEVTRQNLHRRIAVLLDGKLCEAPIIQAELTGGAVPIQGDFTQQQAAELAARINADAGKK